MSSDAESADVGLAVVVTSCDRYSDLWGPFFTAFTRYWANCPYRIFLLSNHRSCSWPGVHALQVGEDVSWSDSLRRGLARVDSPYVLLLQEDFLLEATVAGDTVVRASRSMREMAAVYLRLVPLPMGSPLLDTPYDLFKQIPPNTPYRVSNQAAIWHTHTLLSLLRPGESPWQMEVQATGRSSGIDRPFLAATHRVLVYHPHGAIIAGKWSRRAARRCRRDGHSLGTRPVQTRTSAVAQLAKDWAFNSAFRLMPEALWRASLTRWSSPSRSP